MRLACGLVCILLFTPLTLALSTAGPQALFHDAEVWYPKALLGGFEYSSSGCTPGGSTWSVGHSLDGQEPAWLYDPEDHECLSITSDAPAGNYVVGALGGCAWAQSSDGVAMGTRAVDDGIISLVLFPTKLESVGNFPRFQEYSFGLDVTVVAQFILSSEGDIRGYQWGVGGEVIESTFAETSIEPSDRSLSIELNQGVGSAEVRLEEEIVWKGPVYRSGEEWWQYSPLLDEGPAAGLVWPNGLCA